VLLDRTPAWHPLLRNADLMVGLGVAVLLVGWSDLRGRLVALVAATAIVVGLAGPAAYTLATVSTPHSGAIPSAGPAGAGGFGPGAGGPGGPRAGGPVLAAGPGGRFARGGPFGGAAGPGGGFPGAGVGGLLNASTPSAGLTGVLEQDSGRYTWVAATIGSNQASGYQLATGKPVLAIGGFNGTDPAPTLADFERDVQAGRIHYFIATGGAPGGSGTSSTTSQISAWIESHFTARTVGGVTLYDLTAPLSAGSPAASS